MYCDEAWAQTPEPHKRKLLKLQKDSLGEMPTIINARARQSLQPK